VITVIYDGQCQLCQNSINWLSKKLTFEAVGYQVAQLEKYGLSLAQCEKKVYAVSDGKKYGGVTAVIFLLHARGNRIAALLLKISGPLGFLAYKLIAANRKSLLVRSLSKLIEKLT
jgi:predicted DCC family thiol-disulfide oxidoreductase YuxK